MERYVGIGEGRALWAQSVGSPQAPPMLLVAGADASALSWPGSLVAALARHHRVIRYDHRDTGRSWRSTGPVTYTLTDLAADTRRVLDAFEADGAHLVGFSMGALLVQILMAQEEGAGAGVGAGGSAPEQAGGQGQGLARGQGLDGVRRVGTVSMICAPAWALARDERDRLRLPGPDPRLARVWRRQAEAVTREERIELAVEERRLLNGPVLPFDERGFRRLEAARARAAGPARRGRHAVPLAAPVHLGARLAGNRTPVLVVEAPEDPVNPPAHARLLADRLPCTTMRTVPGLAHVLHPAVAGAVADAVLEHAGTRRS